MFRRMGTFLVISTNSPRVLEAVTEYLYMSNPVSIVIQIEVTDGILLYHICLECDEKLDRKLEAAIEKYLDVQNIPLVDTIVQEDFQCSDE